MKKFRSLLQKKKHNSESVTVYHVRCVNYFGVGQKNTISNSTGPDVMKLKEEFSLVFCSDLPKRLPPECEIEHEIKVELGSRPHHLECFQLSRTKLVVIKEYISDLLEKKKIRPSKSPYCTPLVFVNQKGSLEGAIDY